MAPIPYTYTTAVLRQKCYHNGKTLSNETQKYSPATIHRFRTVKFSKYFFRNPISQFVGHKTIEYYLVQNMLSLTYLDVLKKLLQIFDEENSDVSC